MAVLGSRTANLSDISGDGSSQPHTLHVSIFVHTHSGLSELHGCWPQEDQGRSIPSRVVKSVATQRSPFGGSGLSTAWRCPSVKLLYLTCAVQPLPGLRQSQRNTLKSEHAHCSREKHSLKVQIPQWHIRPAVESDVYTVPLGSKAHVLLPRYFHAA